MREIKVISNIFEFRVGDILQICDGDWADLGTIRNPLQAAKELYLSEFIVSGKPARVIRLQ